MRTSDLLHCSLPKDATSRQKTNPCFTNPALTLPPTLAQRRAPLPQGVINGRPGSVGSAANLPPATGGGAPTPSPSPKCAGPYPQLTALDITAAAFGLHAVIAYPHRDMSHVARDMGYCAALDDHITLVDLTGARSRSTLRFHGTLHCCDRLSLAQAFSAPAAPPAAAAPKVATPRRRRHQPDAHSIAAFPAAALAVAARRNAVALRADPRWAESVVRLTCQCGWRDAGVTIHPNRSAQPAQHSPVSSPVLTKLSTFVCPSQIWTCRAAARRRACRTTCTWMAGARLGTLSPKQG